jgi:DNA repair exonuclease SbcCD ATPase subunit
MLVPEALEEIDEWLSDQGLPPDDARAPWAEESLATLDAFAARLEKLVDEAEALVARFQALARRERLVADREHRATLEREELNASAKRLGGVEAELETLRTELGRREHEVAEAARENAEAVAALTREQERMEELRLHLGPQSPELAGSKDQMCDLLFLPTDEGYALLRENGLALRRGTRLTLTPEGPTFVVSKIAPWPFDGRWCAYLQHASS